MARRMGFFRNIPLSFYRPEKEAAKTLFRDSFPNEWKIVGRRKNVVVRL